MTTALSGVLGGISSLFGAKNPAKTTNNSTTSGSATPTYTGGQSDLQSMLSSILGNRITDSNSQFGDIETAGTDAINRGTAGLQDTLDRNLAARGFSKSGTAGLNMEQLQSQRVGQIGQFQGQLAGLKLQQQNQDVQDALSFAFKNPGSSTSGTSSSTGTQGSSSPLFAGLGGGLQAVLAALSSGGGGGGGGGGDATAPLIPFTYNGNSY